MQHAGDKKPMAKHA